MVSRIAYVGLVILVVGLLLGVYAAYSPVFSTKTTSYSLLSTSLKIDPNDYESQNVPLNQSQTIDIQTVSVTNQTLVFFYIMNQSEYYNWYGCAPWCEAAPANSTAAINAGNNATTPLASTPLATFINQTVTPSSPYSNLNFTAPTAGTYYFVFDNSRGPNYASYAAQNVTGNTIGQFNIIGYGPVTTHAVNSTFLYAGVALLVIGGAIATATWDMGRRPRAPPPRTTTTTTAPPSTPAPSTMTT